MVLLLFLIISLLFKDTQSAACWTIKADASPATVTEVTTFTATGLTNLKYKIEAVATPVTVFSGTIKYNAEQKYTVEISGSQAAPTITAGTTSPSTTANTMICN